MTTRPLLLASAALALAACSAASTTSDTAGAAVAARQEVLPGIEVLLRDSLHLVQGKRVGLITNHSGRDRAGTSTIDLLHRAPNVRLVALFGPEHGIRGAADAGVHVASSVDSATGIPIRSLYGATRVPTPEMLADIDVLVYDIQDVGARVYTYEWTMALAADAAGKLGKKFVVLDRPNPIRGDKVEGGVLDPKYRSFVGQFPVALRYGFTVGELARYLAGTKQITADVTVVPMRGWRRAMWYEETGIPWIVPSPNLRTMEATAFYPGTVFFEGTNLSEGRGTDGGFRLVGAGWLTDAGAIARAMNAKNLPGVRFDSTSRTIAAGQKWGGQTIPMVMLTATDRDRLRPVEVAAHLMREIYARHAKDWQWRVEHMDRLAGDDRLRRAIVDGTVDAWIATANAETARWAAEAREYWIYE